MASVDLGVADALVPTNRAAQRGTATSAPRRTAERRLTRLPRFSSRGANDRQLVWHTGRLSWAGLLVFRSRSEQGRAWRSDSGRTGYDARRKGKGASAISSAPQLRAPGGRSMAGTASSQGKTRRWLGRHIDGTTPASPRAEVCRETRMSVRRQRRISTRKTHALGRNRTPPRRSATSRVSRPPSGASRGT